MRLMVLWECRKDVVCLLHRPLKFVASPTDDSVVVSVGNFA